MEPILFVDELRQTEIQISCFDNWNRPIVKAIESTQSCRNRFLIVPVCIMDLYRKKTNLMQLSSINLPADCATKVSPKYIPLSKRSITTDLSTCNSPPYIYLNKVILKLHWKKWMNLPKNYFERACTHIWNVQNFQWWAIVKIVDHALKLRRGCS